MIPSSPRSTALNAITWLVVWLAAAHGVLRPERAWTPVLSVGLMVAIRFVVVLLARRRSAVVGAAVMGGAVIALALAVAVARAVGLGQDWTSERLLGIVMGAMLLVLGNAIPKASVSPTDRSCAAGGTYAMRRFSGWIFAVAGAVGLAAWLFAPIEQAEVISTVACFSATALVVVRCIASPSTRRSSSERPSHRRAASRRGRPDQPL